MAHMMAASRPTMTQWLCIVEAAEENSPQMSSILFGDTMVPFIE